MQNKEEFMNVVEAVAEGFGFPESFKEHLKGAVEAVKMIVETVDEFTIPSPRTVRDTYLLYMYGLTKLEYTRTCSFYGGITAFSFVQNPAIPGVAKLPKELFTRAFAIVYGKTEEGAEQILAFRQNTVDPICHAGLLVYKETRNADFLLDDFNIKGQFDESKRGLFYNQIGMMSHLLSRIGK